MSSLGPKHNCKSHHLFTNLDDKNLIFLPIKLINHQSKTRPTFNSDQVYHPHSWGITKLMEATNSVNVDDLVKQAWRKSSSNNLTSFFRGQLAFQRIIHFPKKPFHNQPPFHQQEHMASWRYKSRGTTSRAHKVGSKQVGLSRPPCKREEIEPKIQKVNPDKVLVPPVNGDPINIDKLMANHKLPSWKLQEIISLSDR